MHRACDKTSARPCLTAQEDGRGAAHGGGALQDVFELLPQQPDAGAAAARDPGAVRRLRGRDCHKPFHPVPGCID